jgi:hypothetical protein
VGEMHEMIRVYSTEGWPAIAAAGLDRNLVGYFISDTGDLHQLIHIWRFENDAERRDFWNRAYSSAPFMAYVTKLRPLVITQNVQLMLAAPWGPQP